MTDAIHSTHAADRFGRPLDQLERIDRLNQARYFLEATAICIEQFGRAKGANAILATLNAADDLIAKVVEEIEAEWDSAKAPS